MVSRVFAVKNDPGGCGRGRLKCFSAGVGRPVSLFSHRLFFSGYWPQADLQSFFRWLNEKVIYLKKALTIDYILFMMVRLIKQENG